MEIKIEKNAENKLLNRKEIQFTANYAGKTPSKEELKVEICKKLSLSPEFTVIVKVHQVFGLMESKVYVHSYPDKETMKIEPEYIAQRLEKKSAPKEQAEPKQEAKAEAKK